MKFTFMTVSVLIALTLLGCAPSAPSLQMRPDTHLYIRHVESKDIGKPEVLQALAKLDIRDTNFRGVDTVLPQSGNVLYLDVTSARSFGPARSYLAAGFNVTLTTASLAALFLTENPWWVFLNFMTISPRNHIEYQVSYSEAKPVKSEAGEAYWFQSRLRTRSVLLKDFRSSVELLIDAPDAR